MPWKLHPSAPDYAVRPSLRILGAVLLAAMSVLFVAQALPLFGREVAVVGTCPEGKGKWMCVLGSLFMSVVPSHLHGPVLGAASIAFAACLVFLAWLLVQPLVRKVVSAAGASSHPN
jgi:hypothetical protein